MQLQKEIDFEEIYAAQDKLLKHIAQKFKNKLLDIYKQNYMPASIKLEAEYIAKRAIKNSVLKILSALKNDEVAQLAQKQYEESLTMTDRIVALDVLENLHVSYAQTALQNFYDRYKDETLVMNKYFAILASSSRYDVLERVEKLQRDKVYDEKVPNLVRSLVGSFARNHKHFHAKDGSGYKFLADKIIAIDKINPQMASGLCGAFKVCDKMNKHNQDLMKKELSRVISTQGLSKNSFEIIDKILKQT